MQKGSSYIVLGKRTPVGKFLGSLSNTGSSELGACVIREILNNLNLDPDTIDEVILGEVLTSGRGQNVARQTSIKAGLSEKVPAFTINKVCGSGLKSVTLACVLTCSGEADLIIAGGQENMSSSIHGCYMRASYKFGDIKLMDLMQRDGLTDAFSNVAMGVTAENIAKKFHISRKEQDFFALQSHIKASRAQEKGLFKDEIVPVSTIQNKIEKIFDFDETIRADSSMDSLARLRPVFDREGTVTAGNSSSMNDGAACVLVASEYALTRYRLKPLIRIVSHAQIGVDPQIMGTGPIEASRLALKKAGWSVKDLDLVESNEAFAAQSICVTQGLDLDPEKVNVNGGAIALGHPIGASGARILVTLTHQMLRSSAKRALATLCIGGGMGIAICLEKV